MSCIYAYIGFLHLWDSTASWRGGLMQSNATVELPFDRHKVVIDTTFAAWCEVNIEFVEWLLCEAVDAMFCLGYVRKNVRRCQKARQKICQKECQKICQKICQKECQKICQKERQKIVSSQSAKLRVTERISGDELYVYPHLTRSG